MTLEGSPRQAFLRGLIIYAAVGLPWVALLPVGPSVMAMSILLAALSMSMLLLVAAAMPLSRSSEMGMVGLTVAACLSSLAGLLQFSGVLQTVRLGQDQAGTGLVTGGITQAFLAWIAPAPSTGVAYANLRQPNQFATLMAIGWAAVAAFTVNASNAWRLVAMAVTALLALGNAASGSRTGLVLWMLLGIALVLWSRGRPWQRILRWQVLFAWVAYAAAIVVLPALVDTDRGLLRRLFDEAPVCSSRLVLWSNVLQLIAQKPWLGWGWGELDYAHYITQYPGTRFCELLDNAHNLPLHLAVELGIPVAGLACAVAARFVWRRKPWYERDPLRFGAWLILGAIGVHSLLEYPLWYGPFLMTALLCVGMLWRVHPQTGEDRGIQTLSVRTAWTLRGAALILSAAALYAAWDYQRIRQLYLPPQQRAAMYQSDPWTPARRSWLFANHVRFAELMTTPVTAANAQHMAALAAQLLHFSPEPAVVERLILSLKMLGRHDEAAFHQARLRDAYGHRGF